MESSGNGTVQVPDESGAADAAARSRNESAVQGELEGFGPRDAWGWQAWSGPKPPELVIHCGDQAFPANARWIARPDLGLAGVSRAGFQFRIPFEVETLLRADPALAGSLSVRSGGRLLPMAAGVVVSAEDSRVEPWPLETSWREGASCHPVYLWSEDPFRLKCRVEGRVLAPGQVSLLCDGEVTDAAIGYRTVAQSASDASLTELEIELPGHLWTREGGNRSLALQLRLGETTVPAVPISLDIGVAKIWVERQVNSGVHETYDQLLALEHLAALGGAVELPEEAGTYFYGIARHHGLEEIAGVLAAAQGGLKEVRQEADLGSMLTWQSLREFNDRLPEWAGREEQLLATVGEMLPAEEQRHWLYTSVTPYFCRIDRFDAVRQRVPAQLVESMAGAEDIYRASLSLPFLVAEGKVNQAADVLYRIAGQEGWVSGEAVKVASRTAAARVRGDAGVEKFAYALMNLLDRLADVYWSRLHDEQLVEALAVWLPELLNSNQWLSRDVAASAIRVYGLSPVLWDQIAPLLDGDDVVYDELREARRHFRRLAEAAAHWAATEPWPAGIGEDLAYFARMKNHETGRLIRELSASRLLTSTNVETMAGLLPLQELLAQGGEEIVRLAALPVADERPLLARAPALRARLAQMFGKLTHNPRYPLQCRVGALTHRLSRCDDAEATPLLGTLIREVEGLDAAHSHGLAFDVLAATWRRFAHLPAAVPLVSVLAKHAVLGIQGKGDWPSQPLLAGIRNFRAGLSRHPSRIAQTYLDQIQLQLDARHRERHELIEQALATPADLRLSAPDHGDTLVVIYSCRKYLDTRIAAIRDSWLKDLVARGVPYVVLVGDGDGRLDGDVLALEVSDRYEDLPAKTLAMCRWVVTHTDFQYLLKIDDDCLLDVDAWFGSLSYRKFHYYGRIIERATKGAMNRIWHQEKSQSARARLAIDKSPEPSTYADGGGGYCLSRLAMQRLLAESETAWGQRLVASSFMEDKLVGDLLYWARFTVSNEDYYTLVRRRFGKDPVPVCVWDNNFVPSLDSPVKLAHLDTAADMQPVREQMRRRGLWPKKIWPTHALPTIALNSNQLELLTAMEKARALLAGDFFVVAVMRNEKLMLPHFLAHYRRLGARAFIVVDNLSDDGTRESLLAEPDVVLYSADTEYRHSTYGVSWQQTVLAHHCIGKWALVADADELLVYPDCENRSLPEVVAGIDAAGHDAGRVLMIDMYPYGDLDEADFSRQEPFEAAPWFDARPVSEWRLSRGAYGNAVNHVSALRHRLMPAAEPHAFTTQKFCLVRYAPWMRFCAGLHNIANARVSPAPLFFAHFKYHAGLKEKVLEEVARKQHFGNAQEYRRYQAMLSEGRGGFGETGISRRYESSRSFLDAVSGLSGA